jgi:hypothetical protein
MRAWSIAILTAVAALAGGVCATLLQRKLTEVGEPKQLSAVTVTAERFVLVDASGTKRAELGIVGENRNWDGCYSSAPGEPVSTLSGPGLVLYGQNNKPVFSGDPHFRLFARDGLPSLAADLNSEGSSISLYDPRTRTLVPQVVVQAGKMLKPSSGSLAVLDARERVIWHAP